MSTVLWDLQGMIRYQTMKLSDFKQNILSMISLVKSIVGTGSEIGIRTAPLIMEGTDLMSKMNDILREIFVQNNCSIFYDYDKDVWATLNFEVNVENHQLLFRDIHHPSHFFSSNGAKKMLNTSYSSYYKQNNQKTNYLALINDSNFRIKYFRGESTTNKSILYYTRYFDDQRFNYFLNVSEKILGQWMHVSKGDYITLPLGIMNLFPTLYMPPLLDGHLRGVVTKNMALFLIPLNSKFTVIEVSNFTTFFVFHVEMSNILKNVDDFWFDDIRRGKKL